MALQALAFAGPIALLGCSSGDPSTAPRPASVTVGFRFAAGVDAGARTRTARVMQARLRALGVRSATVAVARGRLVASGPVALRRVADAVAARGVLEFRPVLAMMVPGASARISSDGVASDPHGVVLPARSGHSANARFVVGPVAVTGGVRRASARFVTGGMGWSVDLSLASGALRRFNDLATAGVSRPPPQNQVAIVLDGVVLSAPAFVAAQFSGDIQISGDFTHAEARTFAALLNTGASPASVHRV